MKKELKNWWNKNEVEVSRNIYYRNRISVSVVIELIGVLSIIIGTLYLLSEEFLGVPFVVSGLIWVFLGIFLASASSKELYSLLEVKGLYKTPDAKYYTTVNEGFSHIQEIKRKEKTCACGEKEIEK